MKKIVLSGIVASILLSHCFVGIARSEEERKVREIEVRNNKVISTQTILSKLQTKIGTPYTGTILSDDIKRLYASGLFRDVGADIEEKDGGVKVVFTVQEKPVLAKIVFAGNKRIRTKRLLSQMKIKQNEIFDQFKLKEDIEELKKFYAKKGYSSAVITTSEEEKDSKVTVTISVVEHARMRVRKINVDGNTSFAKNRLIKLLKTKRKGWFTSGFFDNDVFQEDTERLLAFYRAEGFIDVKVVSRFDENQTSGAISVTFVIEEGKQYKVGAIAVTGNTVFTRDELLKTVVLQPDTVYSESKLREDISALQSHYFDAGYIASFVKADTVLNAETGNVDLNYAVNEGDIAYVDKINVQGNSRTKDEVIRREMRLYPGDRYNGEKLRRSRQRLYNLGYFEEVSFDTKEQPSTLPDKYDLDVFVKESKTGEFSFGAGYSSVDQFIGFIDLTQRNFDLFNFPMFTGAGQKLRIRMEFGSEKKDYELGFVEPWFLGYPLSMGFNLYSRTREWDKYDEKRIGGNVFLSKDIDEYWNTKLTHRYESIRISDIADDASEAIKLEEGKNYISSLTMDVTHDTRDNVYNPTTGWYNLFSTEYAGGALGGDKDFVKYETTDSRYFPLGQKAVFELKGRAGLAEAFGDSTDVPVYERFYAGGANTIRGYKERRVGPEGEQGDPVGGRIRLLGNAEYTYQLAKNLKWAFFYDIGNVWADLNEFQWDNLKLKASIGTGVRVKTPLGPIRLDYGYALNPKPGDARGRFHFAISHEF